MADEPNDSARPLADPRWLKITRLTAVAPLLVALGITVSMRFSTMQNTCSEFSGFVAFAIGFITLPYILSSVHLWGRSSPRLKKGLAWAIVAGGFWGLMVPVATLAVARPLLDMVMPLLWTLLQAVLVMSAITTYYSMPREKGDVRILVGRGVRFIPYLVVLGVIAVALPNSVSNKGDRRAASAVGALRAINMAEITYFQTYSKGYSTSLAELAAAASAHAAGDGIDAALASGAKDDYTFRYTPGPPEASGQITTYTVTATPSEPACTLWKRFFTDQTGKIRMTTENRPATVNDSALGE
jgi:uncharacterized membrane protein YhaH (DUF805 family)